MPACRDSDDQKFLEAALAAHAGFLITKDRALLELAPRVAAFRILAAHPGRTITTLSAWCEPDHSSTFAPKARLLVVPSRSSGFALKLERRWSVSASDEP